MKLYAKESKSNFITEVVLTSIYSCLLLSFSYMIISQIGITSETIIPLLLILFIILYQLRAFALLDMSENYELVLDYSSFTYKSRFKNIAREYKEIRDMKIKRYKYGRISKHKYLLVIKIGALQRVYIPVNPNKTKTYKAIKDMLINKTNLAIAENFKR